MMKRHLAWLGAVMLLGGCAQAHEGRIPLSLTQGAAGHPDKLESASSEEHSSGTPRTSSYGVLHGRVSRGPLPPATGHDGRAPLDGPVGAAHIGVQLIGVEHVWWGVTSFDGTYAMLLPAGTYQVTMVPAPGMGIARDLPATVTILPGQQTRLDIRLDTRLR